MQYIVNSFSYIYNSSLKYQSPRLAMLCMLFYINMQLFRCVCSWFPFVRYQIRTQAHTSAHTNKTKNKNTMDTTKKTTPTNYSNEFAKLVRLENEQGYSSELIEKKNNLIKQFNEEHLYFFPCRYSSDCDISMMMNLHLICNRYSL